MSFGKKILEKYGFKDGSGLGKYENGITEPIKVNFKFDNSGLGDKGPAREDHWWERVFNEASCNVSIQKAENGKISVDLHDKDGVEITNKSFSMKKLKQSKTTLQYGSFLKSATLLANVGKEKEIDGHLSTTDIEIKPVQVLSDEALFKACGGRTAHKGARHGLKLTGKLQRIAEQEKELLERMKGKQNKHEVFREPVSKKLKINPLAELNSSTSDDCQLPVDTDSDYIASSKKKKKKDRKRDRELATHISEFGLDEARPKSPAEPEPYNGTPVRKKKKKSKKSLEHLAMIQEAEASSEETPKRKKKKGKRKRDEDDESMAECKEKYLKDKQKKIIIAPKKIRLDDFSHESSEDGDKVIEKLNEKTSAEKTLKLARSHKRKLKKQLQETASDFSKIL